MDAAQTKKNLRWSIFVFSWLFLLSSAFYVVADESAATSVVAFDDADGDNLTTEEEKIYGTDPAKSDTDNDGYTDGIEIEGGFDPLKPAPGDRVVSEDVVSETNAGTEEPVVNFTEKATEELVNIVQRKSESEEELSITQDDLNGAMENVMALGYEPVELPEVDTTSLEVKEVPTNLSADEAEEQNRQDVIEYLTLTSYILISNAPVRIEDSESLKGFAIGAGQKMIVGILSGNYDFLDSIENNAQNALREVEKVTVPKSMLGTHVKTVKMLTFASNLKHTIKSTTSPNDPMGQMYMFARVQGFLMSLDVFMQETNSLLSDFGIKNIPLDI